MSGTKNQHGICGFVSQLGFCELIGTPAAPCPCTAPEDCVSFLPYTAITLQDKHEAIRDYQTAEINRLREGCESSDRLYGYAVAELERARKERDVSNAKIKELERARRRAVEYLQLALSLIDAVTNAEAAGKLYPLCSSICAIVQDAVRSAWQDGDLTTDIVKSLLDTISITEEQRDRFKEKSERLLVKREGKLSRRVLSICQAWVIANKVRNASNLYKTPCVVDDLPALGEQLCNEVGYYDDETGGLKCPTKEPLDSERHATAER